MRRLTAAGLALVANGAAWAASSPEDAAKAAHPAACAEMLAAPLDLTEVKITDAANAPAKDIPACVIRGKAAPRTGADGKSYAIGFEMRLPPNWNGRFLHQVNGGNDGAVIPAVGVPGDANSIDGKPALARGFAVLSSDEGHDGKDPANASFKLGAGAAFGLDPRAREDYGYAADAKMAEVGPAITAKFYGVAPARSYMMGCSNGGRHAMVAASRMGEAYDGFVAGDPGFDLPRAAIQHAWDVQNFLAIDPDIAKSFSVADMSLIGARVGEACDGLDGVNDGIVADLRACQKTFSLESLACKGDKSATCLSASQVKALTRDFEGPHNSKGEQLYSDWPFDPGMSGRNWRFWKIFSGIPAWDGNPLIATLGAASLAEIFTTPPTIPPGDPEALMAYLAHFDFDRDAPKIYAHGAFEVNGRQIDYAQSAWEFMTPPDADNPKLETLRKAGHKLLIYHGQSDPVFSFNATARWFERLDANLGGKAAETARLFAVPGMTHCSGGPATDAFDALGALVDWVEKGRAPDRLLAHVRADNKEVPAAWSPARTRPLCPWPRVARYIGGDVEKAESFACR